MKTSTTVYPEFVPNQVLTNTQLNQLREHLDQQTRLSRIRLTGTGIVCGLDWHVVVGPDSLTVTEGFGISSDGYMIQLPQTEYFHVREYLDPDKDDDDNPNYSPWRSEGDIGGQIALWELLEEAVDATDEQPGSVPFTDFDVSNKVIVLYLERDPEELNSCLVTECDNKGLNIRFTVRALFVNSTDVTQVPTCDPPAQWLRTPRLHTERAIEDLASSASINVAYREIVEGSVDQLADAILAAGDKYMSFLRLRPTLLDDIRNNGIRLGRLVSAGEGNQYYYDALKDLTQAYNEFIAEACELEIACCPDQAFPRHLMLGETESSSGYRHKFAPAPVRNVMHLEFERIRRLFLRIVTLDKCFGFPVLTPVKIIPSHTELHPLGQRAIPHYYGNLAISNLPTYWQPQDCCTITRPWSYDRGPSLDTDYSICSFLRIEGHVGDECGQARRSIERFRSEHNVEFDICVSHLQDRREEEDTLSAAIEELRLRRNEIVAELEARLSDDWPSIFVDIEDLLEEIRSIDGQINQSIGAWSELRNERILHCSIESLQTNYETQREKLLCLGHTLNAQLSHLVAGMLFEYDADEAPWALAPGLQDAAKRMGPGWGARALAYGSITVHLGDLARRADERSQRDSADEYEDAFYLLLLAAKGSLASVVQNFLPRDLRAFHLESFSHQYAEAVELLRTVWATWETFMKLVPASPWWPSANFIFSHPPESMQDAIAGIQNALQSCEFIAATAHRFDFLRNSDSSLFRNLASGTQGLEHLGGVDKGGTFVLVCDRTGGEERVVADFSLAGKLSCCCDLDRARVCLPPVALPDYRIAILAWDAEVQAYAPLDIEIHVLANDYDPNHPRDDSERLKVVVPNASDHGGELSSDGRKVTYRHPDPRPGLVDRFDYELELLDDDCPGTARGHVLVMHAVSIDEVEPGVTGIHGFVEFDYGEPAGSASIQASGPHFASGTTGPNGEYSIDTIPPGDYTLQASSGEYFSGLVAVTVLDSQLSEAPRLIIQTAPQVGTIKGTVTVNQEIQGGVRVDELETPQDATTDTDGTYVFDNLAPGTYRLRASDQGATTEERSVQVLANQTRIADFNLTRPTTGDLMIGVTDVQGALIDEVTVTIVSLDGEYTQETTELDEVFLAYRFESVPYGDYVAHAYAPGYLVGELDFVHPTQELLWIWLIRFGLIVVPDNPVVITSVAESGNLSVTDAKEKVQSTYLSRYVTHLQGFAAAGKDKAVHDSATYQKAKNFLTVTAIDPDLDNATITEAYTEMATLAARTIKRARPDRADAYRSALAAASLAFVDRLSATNHETLNPQMHEAIKEMAMLLRGAGIDMAELRAEWNGRELRDELHMGSTDAIGRLLR